MDIKAQHIRYEPLGLQTAVFSGRLHQAAERAAEDSTITLPAPGPDGLVPCGAQTSCRVPLNSLPG